MIWSLKLRSKLRATPLHQQAAKNGLEDTDAFGSAPLHSLSQSPARKPTCNQPETWYCLEIQVISTEDDKVIPPPTHAWQAPVVEDMVWEGKAGLTEAIVAGPGWAVLFYGWWSLGEGLSLGEVRDTMFTLSGVIAWVGKQAQLSTKPVSLGEGRCLIAQAITEGHIEPRGPAHPQSIPPASAPFNFWNQDLSPWYANLLATTKWWEVPWLESWAGQHEWGWALQQGQRQQELWVAPLRLPLLSSGHGFESDRSTASTLSSLSERPGGLRHPHHGWCPCQQPGGHMKINLLVFKDEDTNDAVTYQSWHWDLTLYHCTRCLDHTLLLYAICSWQSYLGELERSSRMDITLDDILTILDKHYSNVKALDTLNQELFQLHMGEKEMVSDWGVCLSRHCRSLQHHSLNAFPQTM